MKTDNNGYLRTGARPEDSELLPSVGHQGTAAGVPLQVCILHPNCTVAKLRCHLSQVTIGPRGNAATSIPNHAGNALQGSIGGGVARGRGRTHVTTNRQRIIGVVVFTLVASCMFTLLILALNTSRECDQEIRE